MFNKLLAAAGVGGATVDTVIQNSQLSPGDTLRGEVVIHGGSVEQTIEQVVMSLNTQAEHEVGDNELHGRFILGKFQVAGVTQIAAHQELRIPFAIQLPLETPVNQFSSLASPGCKPPQMNMPIWIETDLALAFAVDKHDRDRIEVRPLPQMVALIKAFGELGYQHVRSDVEVGQLRAGSVVSSLGCYQEMEFRPKAGFFHPINEIELSFIPRSHNQVYVVLEVDRKHRGDSFKAFEMGANWQQIDWALQLKRYL